MYTKVPLCECITSARHLAIAARLRSTPPPYRQPQQWSCCASTGLAQIWLAHFWWSRSVARLRGQQLRGVQHQSPIYSNTETAVLSLVGFTAGLHEVGSGVWRGLREEVYTVDRRCGKAFKKLLVKVPLDGGDTLFSVAF